MLTIHIQGSIILLFFIMSLSATGLYFISFKQKSQPYLLYFGLFLLSMCANMAIVLRMGGPLADSTSVKLFSYSAGVFFLLFYEQIFGSGKHGFNRRLWQFHLSFLFLIGILTSLSPVRLGDIYIPSSFINLATIIYIAVITIFKARSGNNDAKIFTAGLSLLTVTIVIDILSAVKSGSFASLQTSVWGLLLFTLSLTGILLKRYMLNGVSLLDEPLTFYQNSLEMKMRADSMVLHTLKNELHRLLYLNERNKKLITGLEPTSKAKAEENLSAMDEAMVHMAEMIAAVKRTDDLTLNTCPTNLNDLILNSLEVYQNKNVQISASLPFTAIVDGDPLHIKECLNNLLQNSCEAIEEGTGKISLNLKKDAAYYIIDVSDNGKGIPKENMDDVLLPFFTTKKDGKHHGVGLYYNYFVMKKHGGFLKVWSEPGKGTTVQLFFPRLERKVRSGGKLNGKN